MSYGNLNVVALSDHVQ